MFSMRSLNVVGFVVGAGSESSVPHAPRAAERPAAKMDSLSMSGLRAARNVVTSEVRFRIESTRSLHGGAKSREEPTSCAHDRRAARRRDRDAIAVELDALDRRDIEVEEQAQLALR